MGYKEQKQRQFDLRYLQMARVWAENSYCVRRKVGALLVKDKMIISDGYNGTPAGFETATISRSSYSIFITLRPHAYRVQHGSADRILHICLHPALL